MDLLQALAALPQLVADYKKAKDELIALGEDRVMTVEEAAEYLRVSSATIRNYIRRGWITSTRIKTGETDSDVFVRLRKSDLDSFLLKGRVEAKR